jgi:flavin-dependent dehydrogenase
MRNTARLEVDVAIFGAGPAGSATALSLRQRDVSAIVLEAQPTPGWRIGETLPPAARPLLQTLGVLAAFESEGHLPSYGNLSAWGSEELASTDFIFNPHGNGWQLDRKRFDALLANAARDEGAHLWYGCRLRQPLRDAGGRWEFEVQTCEGVQSLRARWLVDATGRRAACARRLGARRATVDALVGVYALATPSGAASPPDHDARTLVEAAPDGWWYTAVVPGGLRTVVWLSDADLLRQQHLRTAEGFRAQANATRHVVRVLKRHGYEFVGPPRCTPACSGCLDPCTGPGWLAVGDAAISLDPLSSQGLINAVSTGWGGGQAVADLLAGAGVGLRGYVAEIETTWDDYLRNRATYYGAEGRWRHRPFWRRRNVLSSPGLDEKAKAPWLRTPP